MEIVGGVRYRPEDVPRRKAPKKAAPVKKQAEVAHKAERPAETAEGGSPP